MKSSSRKWYIISLRPKTIDRRTIDLKKVFRYSYTDQTNAAVSMATPWKSSIVVLVTYVQRFICIVIKMLDLKMLVPYFSDIYARIYIDSFISIYLSPSFYILIERYWVLFIARIEIWYRFQGLHLRWVSPSPSCSSSFSILFHFHFLGCWKFFSSFSRTDSLEVFPVGSNRWFSVNFKRLQISSVFQDSSK